MAKRDLLIELGTEELPPKALKSLSESFYNSVCSQLSDAGLTFSACENFAAPRRLAVLVKELDEKQADKQEEKRGPALQAAFDADGNPSKAAEGFARSCGVNVSELSQLETDKGTWLAYNALVKGKASAELVPTIIEKALAQLPIPKRMRWGSRKVQFVRPSQWLVVLFGNEVIDCTILDQKSGNTTRGHRFHSEGELTITNAADYEKVLLEQGKVMARFEQRRQQIIEQCRAEAKSLNATPVWSDDLLDEVAALVEWPVPLVGEFEQRFLDVPQEALIYTMQDNQKYFPLLDANQQLLNKFIFVSNIESTDPQQVIDGNEKVVRPRLADAEFVNNQDKKKTLSELNEACKKSVFQNELGTVFEKAQRISVLAGEIATAINADAELATQAGLLCKADLNSDMVCEFAAMQGVMGRYLGKNDGLHEEVSLAFEEQYLPRFATDILPSSQTGMAVALADRIDTLVGIFGIGQKPTGDKDPFALRRASLGILRIIIEGGLNLDIKPLLEKAQSLYGNKLSNENVLNDVLGFINSRYRAKYKEQGIPTESILSVLALQLSQPLDINKRILAVDAFKADDSAQALAAANKRVSNILAKEKQSTSSVDEALLIEPAEKILFAQLSQAKSESDALAAQQDYIGALKALSQLREPVDAFFDSVMVMADDEKLKTNRIALLTLLRNSFLSVADISLLND